MSSCRGVLERATELLKGAADRLVGYPFESVVIVPSAMTDSDSPVWFDQLKVAIKKNRRDAHNRYFQLASVDTAGMPRNRTVVFRGFSDALCGVLAITDARSEKLSELAAFAQTEICWYFTQSREQFRLACEVKVHTASDDGDLRLKIWASLSDAAREQFFWQPPGLALGEGSSLTVSAAPPDNFVVLECIPHRVDHLVLGQVQRRMISTREGVSWYHQEVNP